MAKAIRCALVQIRSHPAFLGTSSACLDEPFYDANCSLRELAVLGLDTHPLPTKCREQYLSWAGLRLESILADLKRRGQFHLIVFPEYSVPAQLLPMIHSFAKSTGTAILAGSHTPVKLGPIIDIYQSVELSPSQIRAIVDRNRVSILPVIEKARSQVVEKATTSPQERGDTSTTWKGTALDVQTIVVESQGIKFRLAPLLCSDALQGALSKKDHELTVVLSFDHNPKQFVPFLTQQATSGKHVLYVNDAAFGGSGIHSVADERLDHWAFRSGLAKSLPAEEAIMICELDLECTSPRVGTADPASPYEVTDILPIVYDSENARTLGFQKLLSTNSGTNQLSKQYLLSDVAKRFESGRVGEKKLAQLIELVEQGRDTAESWRFCSDYVQAKPCPISALQATLSSECSSTLPLRLSKFVGDTAVLGPKLVRFFQRAGGLAAQAPTTTLESAQPFLIDTATIDRETEVKELLAFVESDHAGVAELLGLPYIGKSTVISKLIGQTALPPSAVRRVQLLRNPSPEYLLAALSRNFLSPPTINSNPAVLRDELRTLFQGVRILIIENAHELAYRGRFVDSAFEALIRTVREACGLSRTRLIFETRYQLPLEEPTRKLRIRGFEHEKESHGIDLLDLYLRKAQLNPRNVPDQQRKLLVGRLGGHPQALGIAAARASQVGFDKVYESTTEAKGYWNTYVDDLVANMEVSADEETILRVLSGCTIPIWGGALQAVLESPVQSHLEHLTALSLVGIDEQGRFYLPSLFRFKWQIEMLPSQLQKQVHLIAAQTFAKDAKESNNVASQVAAEYHASLASFKLDVNSHLPDAQLMVARELYESQRYDEASKVLESLLKLSSRLEIKRLAALVEARSGHFASAVRLAREVFQIAPTDTRLLGDVAKAAFTRGEEAAVDELIHVAEKAGMDDASIQQVKGQLYMKRGNLPQAIQSFERARKLNTRDIWPYFYLAKAEMRSGDVQTAIDTLEDGLELYYENQLRNRGSLAAARGLLAEAYMMTDDLESAGKLVSSMNAGQLSNPEMARVFAFYKVRTEGVESAVKAYGLLKAQGFRDRFDKCRFHLFYGLFLLSINDYGAACAEFESAHSSDKTNVYVLVRWARAILELAEQSFSIANSKEEFDVSIQQAAQASTIVTQVIKLDPDNKDALSMAERIKSGFNIVI